MLGIAVLECVGGSDGGWQGGRRGGGGVERVNRSEEGDDDDENCVRVVGWREVLLRGKEEGTFR